MQLFYSKDHHGHWGVGVASIVIAENKFEAIKLLDEQLRKDGLKDSTKVPYTLTVVTTEIPHALILHNGDY